MAAIDELGIGRFKCDKHPEGECVCGPYIALYGGAHFPILNPHPDRIDLDDIAHALSNLCRYTGHTDTFYSVAQHSVLVSEWLEGNCETSLIRNADGTSRGQESYDKQRRDLTLTGLLHDAAEAYIGDISRPMKQVMEQLVPGILKGIEHRIEKAVAERFGFTYPFPDLVKTADNVILATEKRDLMPRIQAQWADLPDPIPYRIRPQPAEAAREDFLRRFHIITQGG